MPPTKESENKTLLAISSSSELGLLWRTLIQNYTQVWLRRTLTGTCDLRMLAARVKRFESLIDLIIVQDESAEVLNVLRGIVLATYNENFLEEIFQDYLQLIYVTGPVKSPPHHESMALMPSVKFLTTEFAHECLLGGLWDMLELQ